MAQLDLIDGMPRGTFRTNINANFAELYSQKAPLASPAFTGTVTGVTAAMVGLGNVANTSDANKPVSTAQQAALDLKAPLASPAFTGTPTGITKAHVGLGNVDNTADTAKPVSTAQQTALNLKANIAAPSFTGLVTTAGQVAFPATQNPSVDPNTLDDYEEGTFTPTIAGTTTPGTGTYTAQNGAYTKIGNVVTFIIELNWSAHTGTGGIQVSGLPFTNKALFVPVTMIASNLTFSGMPIAGIVQSDTRLLLYSVATGAAIASIAMDTAALLFLQGTYLTA